jgi:hypothetical protein
MKLVRLSTLAVLVFVGVAACDNSVAPNATDAAAVDGFWDRPSEDLLQHTAAGLPPAKVGSVQSRYSFYRGSFAYELFQYGGYDGEPVNQLTVISRREGTYRFVGNRIYIETTLLVEWTRSNGAGFTARVTSERAAVHHPPGAS